MVSIPVLNNKFESKDKIETSVGFTKDDINTFVVHQVVKAALANRRQGNASTKTKALVQGGGCKPFKQKGTGRARQGSSRSPLMPGGGTTFGPSPRSYEQKINKKMALNGIHSVLADKFQAGKLTVIDTLESNGKTKELFKVLNDRGLLPGLVVTAKKDSPVIRAARNLRHGKALPVDGFSVYEAVKYENLVIEKEALNYLLNKLV